MIRPPLIVPTKDEVLSRVGIYYNPSHPIADPTENESELYIDHSEFIIKKWLPLIRPPFHLWAIVVEAYLSGMEAYSDGSSVVPDYLYRNGNMKDPQGITHDYLFHLHRIGATTALGYTYGYMATHRAYRDLCWIDRWYAQAAIRYAALVAFSWPLWFMKYDGPEPLDHEIVTA